MRTARIFSDSQITRLKLAVRVEPDYARENPHLELVIAELKNESPHLFWTPDTLKLRRFFHEPKFPIHYRSHEANYEV